MEDRRGAAAQAPREKEDGSWERGARREGWDQRRQRARDLARTILIF
jgi:hypothetical protein